MKTDWRKASCSLTAHTPFHQSLAAWHTLSWKKQSTRKTFLDKDKSWDGALLNLLSDSFCSASWQGVKPWHDTQPELLKVYWDKETSEEMKREFPSSPWVRWVPVCGWLPCCVLLLCLLQVGRSDAPLRRVCVGACVFYPSSDETLLKFTSVSSEREHDWKRERLRTRKKFTQTDGEQLLGSASGKLTARAVSRLELYYINLDYCLCRSCCQSARTECLNVSLLHTLSCTSFFERPFLDYLLS